MSSEIDAPNECPAMELQTVTIPGHALDAARESCLTIRQLTTLQGSVVNVRQLLGNGIHSALAYLSSRNRSVDPEVVGELFKVGPSSACDEP
jgi:hypothetical protein